MRVAAELYPRDRVVLNAIGRLLFLQRRFDDAIAAFQKALEVDPEDVEAHYNLMLSYQGAGRQRARRTGAKRSTPASRPTNRRRRSPGRSG